MRCPSTWFLSSSVLIRRLINKPKEIYFPFTSAAALCEGLSSSPKRGLKRNTLKREPKLNVLLSQLPGAEFGATSQGCTAAQRDAANRGGSATSGESGRGSASEEWPPLAEDTWEKLEE